MKHIDPKTRILTHNNARFHSGTVPDLRLGREVKLICVGGNFVHIIYEILLAKMEKVQVCVPNGKLLNLLFFPPTLAQYNLFDHELLRYVASYIIEFKSDEVKTIDFQLFPEHREIYRVRLLDDF